MRQMLSRNRIKGVTFHRKSAASLATRNAQIERGGLELNRAQIEAGAPAPFSRHDIRRLLTDLARQQLHTNISEAVEACGHWRQVMSVMESLPRSEARFGESSFRLGGISEDDSDAEPVKKRRSNVHPDLELSLEVRRVFRLWKHRLALLELLAEAQYPLQIEAKTKQRNKKSGGYRF